MQGFGGKGSGSRTIDGSSSGPMSDINCMLRSGARARAQRLQDRLVQFGAVGCRIAARLPSSGMGRPIRQQLIHACTSPAANYAEARESESHRNSIHKLKLCLKELRETRVWLELIAELELLSEDQLSRAITESDELISILVVSVNRSKGSRAKRPPRMGCRNS